MRLHHMGSDLHLPRPSLRARLPSQPSTGSVGTETSSPLEPPPSLPLGSPFDDTEFRKAYEDLFGDHKSWAFPLRTPTPRSTPGEAGAGDGSRRKSVDGFFDVNKIRIRTSRRKPSAGLQRSATDDEADGRRGAMRSVKEEFPPSYGSATRASSAAVVDSDTASSIPLPLHFDKASARTPNTSDRSRERARSTEDRHVSAREEALKEGWKHLRDSETSLRVERKTLDDDRQRLVQEQEELTTQQAALQEEKQAFAQERDAFRQHKAFFATAPRSFTPASFTSDGTEDEDEDDNDNDNGNDDNARSETCSIPSSPIAPSPATAPTPDPAPDPEPDVKASYKAYTALWTTLPRTSPLVPYPTPTHSSAALLTPHPSLRSPTTENTPWSPDALAKYHACHFFLSAHSIPASASTDAGAQRIRAELAGVGVKELRALVSGLRRELRRWHEDGLRVRGLEGEWRARACFVGFRELRDEVLAVIREKEGEGEVEDGQGEEGQREEEGGEDGDGSVFL